MSTKWRQKAPSVLAMTAVAALLLLLVLLWTAVQNGSFSDPQQERDLVDSKLLKLRDPSFQKLAEKLKSDGSPYGVGDSVRLRPPLTFVTTTSTTTQSPTEIRQHLNSQSREELVRPTKLPPKPMHTVDMLTEMHMKDAAGDKSPIVLNIMATGTYRKSSNRVWDAYPEYLISAFGLHLDIQLRQSNEFISKNLKVSHVSHSAINESRIQHEPSHEVGKLHGCFYTGQVKGDALSKVSVSLCEGMKGNIYTSYGAFIIEPVEAYSVENPNVLHKITQMVTHVKKASSSSSSAGEPDTNSNEDDPITEDTTIDNIIHRHKRSLPAPQPTNAYTMKVLVGVDAKMQAYHRENSYDLKEYILTLMSIVSTVYSDPSIGNAINIAVVDIVHLGTLVHPTDSGHIAGVSASQMLSEFCNYVERHSRKKHDVALLLTREQICRSGINQKCDTLGLAQLGTMCRPSSCAIVQDNGLAAAFTIAHELGHVLDMPHDDDNKCNRFKKDAHESENIMSRMLGKDVHPWSWSKCSRHYVTAFLETNHGLCMLNLPERDIVESSSVTQQLAGEKFTADDQCRLIYGPESTSCYYMTHCETLWCGNETDGCLTLLMPWADGTSCTGNSSDEHWCQRGKCVHRNPSAMVKVDGGWGPWSRYTKCSRTCGGGITSTKRECNHPTPKNGGKYCVGQRIRYESCNVENCPPDEVDFREQQCSSKDGNTFDVQGISTNVKYVPKYAIYPPDECKLVCRVAQSTSHFVLEDKVIDGTSCAQDTFNKCVNGICRPAACDNRLNSQSTLDKCGVCGGLNDSCTDVSKVLTKAQLMEMKRHPTRIPFYYDACNIPKGASNIQITQMGHVDDMNYIVLLDDNGTSLVNGNNVILQYAETIPYGGVTFTYTGTNANEEQVNSIYTRKLNRNLRVQIMSRTDHYPYDEMITCVYTRPLGTDDDDADDTPKRSIYAYNENTQAVEPYSRVAPTPQTVIHQWQLGEWSSCNALCNGTRSRSSDCVLMDRNEKRLVAGGYCIMTRPKTEESCNTHCSFRWEPSACPRDCESARSAVALHCIKDVDNEMSTVKDNSYCADLPKPHALECSSPCLSFSDWSECCRGQVHQQRTVECKSSPHNGIPINKRHCQPVDNHLLVRTCNTNECPAYYDVETTSLCSVTCGEGVLMQTTHCVKNHGIVSADKCAHLNRPEIIPEQCSRPSCPVAKETSLRPSWQTAVVSPRRSMNEVQAISLPRLLTTTTTTTTTTTPSPTTTTEVIFVPRTRSTVTTTSTTTTTTLAPISYTWRSTMWTGCSETGCSGTIGVRQRQVHCFNEQNVLQPDRMCASMQKPMETTKCDRLPVCPVWKTEAWQECADDCHQSRSVRCMKGTDEVSDFYCRQMLSARPPERQNCCSYKWKSRWSTCSTTCGPGIRKRQPVCLRFHPKAANLMPIRKRGTIVGDSACDENRIPAIKHRQKPCKKPCIFPKWQFTPWSKCTSGCGKGYMRRNIKCMVDKQVVADDKCQIHQKPKKLAQCDSKVDCEWREDPWRNCTCNGTTKRRVLCFDRALKKPASNCDERRKPPTKEHCKMPDNCSCKSIQEQRNVRQNGNYILNIRGKPVEIHCHDMNTEQPKEYIRLPAGENYAIYYDKRSSDKNRCPRTEADTYKDYSLPSGVTHFKKVRLDLHRLVVIEDDYQFVRWSGTRIQSFGSAGDCFSLDQACPRGRFSVNFEGTRFHIRTDSTWDRSPNATITYEKRLEPPFKAVSAFCSGYCGTCYPNKNTGIQLEIDD